MAAVVSDSNGQVELLLNVEDSVRGDPQKSTNCKKTYAVEAKRWQTWPHIGESNQLTHAVKYNTRHLVRVSPAGIIRWYVECGRYHTMVSYGGYHKVARRRLMSFVRPVDAVVASRGVCRYSF